MAKPTRSTGRAITFSLFLVMATLYFWLTSFVLPGDGGTLNLSFGSLFFLLLLVILQFFLLYRMLSSLRAFPSITERLDVFFYEDRCGSFVLAVMCVVWFMCACYATLCAYYTTRVIGVHILDPPEKKGWEWESLFSESGHVEETLLELFCLFSPLALVGCVGWFGYTAAMGFWRVVAPKNSGYTKVAQRLDEELGDDWEVWQIKRSGRTGRIRI